MLSTLLEALTAVSVWLACGVGAVLLLAVTEMLIWLWRSKEWKLKQMEIMRQWKSELGSGRSPLWLLVAWPLLIVFLVWTLAHGRSISEQLIHMDGKTPTPPNARRNAWLDTAQGPLRRQWVEATNEEMPCEGLVFVAFFRQGMINTHIIIRPEGQHEWGAFRIHQDAPQNPKTPFAQSEDPTVLQRACERDRNWLHQRTPMEV